ncbi:VLDLR [Mytilus coruscus]|uniref:VLDLR n=1 Tax=Mytilus coruscus TaxID=42192 RepID=A0A6J8C327_MYTCO|nr:VLDLR [Mytilus coruscus]
MKLHQTMLCMQSLLIMIAGVYEIDLDTGEVRTLTRQNEQVFSMAYDHKKRYVYVPRYSTGDIVRFPYPNNHTVMLGTIVSTIYPVGIAFDSVNSHLYWTEISPGRIMRCNPDGSDVTILLNENKPTALTLDIQNRWIYYAQQLSPSEIFRTNFDGMDKRVIIKNLTTYVLGIGVDVDVERLYWMEYYTGDLQSAWDNGSDVKTIISTNVTIENWDIDMDEDFIFYTSYNQIIKINKFLGQIPTVVHTDTQRIYGVLLYKQDGKNTSIRNTI